MIRRNDRLYDVPRQIVDLHACIFQGADQKRLAGPFSDPDRRVVRVRCARRVVVAVQWRRQHVRAQHGERLERRSRRSDVVRAAWFGRGTSAEQAEGEGREVRCRARGAWHRPRLTRSRRRLGYRAQVFTQHLSERSAAARRTRVANVLALHHEHDHLREVGRMIGDALEILADRLQARRPVYHARIGHHVSHELRE